MELSAWCERTGILYLRAEERHSVYIVIFLLTSRPALILSNKHYGLHYEPNTL
jgi:hypothetical protein